MALSIVKCPTCKQKLAIQDVIGEGMLVVCANLKCGTSLKVVSRHPAKIELVPEKDTYSVDYRPESYG